jgi:hypothetical protein
MLLYRFLYLSSPEIVNGCKGKQTTAPKYCKSGQIKATMVKRKRQKPAICTEAYRIGLLTLLRHMPDYFSYHLELQSGVIFTPRRVPDYCLLWRSVNSSRIRYENRDAPMQSQRRNEGLPEMQRANQCGSLLFKLFILNAPFD